MNEFILSRILSGILGCAFIIVRIFFSISLGKNRNLSQKDKRITDHEGNFNFVVRRYIIFPLLIFFIWSYYYLNPSWMQFFLIKIPSVIIWILTVIGFIGIAFLTWVHVCLGKEWSANLKIRDGHTLIKSGPYSKIRHPMYTSLFMVYLSFALVSGDFLIIIVTLFAIISLILRLPKEEEMLITEFGDDYKDYKLNTGKFFPKL
jgi:protein-S-isoprenylcysteine O-methyltransferase Ste14